MKIGFTGTESVGKSSTINAIFDLLSKDFIIDIVSAGKLAANSPHPLVDRQDFQSSRWILEQIKLREIAMERECDVLLCDRTILDVWIFSKIAARNKHLSQDELDQLEGDILDWLPTYRNVFIGTIDRCIPVSMSNLPNNDLQIRDNFERVLLEEIRRLSHVMSFSKMPHVTDQRIRQVRTFILAEIGKE